MRKRFSFNVSLNYKQKYDCCKQHMVVGSYLVLLVVTGEVGEDTRGAGHDVNVRRAEQLDKTL